MGRTFCVQTSGNIDANILWSLLENQSPCDLQHCDGKLGRVDYHNGGTQEPGLALFNIWIKIS